MILRMILQTGAWLVFTAALLFFAAGRIDWRPGWDFIAVMGVSTFAIGFWLARRDPSLLTKRLGSLVQKDQAAADKIFMPAALAVFYVWLVVMALDSGRFGWSHVPLWAQGLGGLLMILTMVLCSRVFRENSFAAPVVKIQEGQSVITTGPYAIVRHPMYASALPLFLGAPLLLGSWWGLVFVPVFAVGIGWRALMEEKTLRTALSSYDDYARHVRYRLAPFVW